MKLVSIELLNRFWTNGINPIKTLVNKKLDAAKIANNCTTTEAGYALDARQGKELREDVDEINSNLSHLSSDLTKLENDLTHIEYISLYETSALAVMAYIKQKWAEYGIYQNGFIFNFLVNNANWYSGIMYSDNTNTWWGIVQERNNGIDTIKTYQYFGDSVGADSVFPFKSQQDVDNAYNAGYEAGAGTAKTSTTITVRYGTSDAGHGICEIYSKNGSKLFGGYNNDGGWNGNKTETVTVPVE